LTSKRRKPYVFENYCLKILILCFNFKNMFRLFLLIFLALSQWCLANPLSKIDVSLLERYKTQPVCDYVVLLKDRIAFDKQLPLKTKKQKGTYVYQTLRNHAEKTQQEIRSILKQQNVVFRAFYVTNAIQVKSDYATMLELAQRSDVDRIIDDAPFKMLDEVRAERQPTQRNAVPEWGISRILADSVWSLGYTGQGVVIGGQDTGYDWWVSPLKSKYRGFIDSTSVDHNYNWYDAIHEKQNPDVSDTIPNPCGYNLLAPCDDHDHGTHTMGTMVGQDDANVIGVAPGAKWIACRNMERGWGRPSSYMECFEWLLAPFDLEGNTPDPTKAPHVINNSWYCSEEEGCNPSNIPLMEDIVKNLKAAGIVVVVSAGNDGRRGCGSIDGPPALFDASFSVAASDFVDSIAGFSSRGPVVIDSSFRMKPNVTAPGVGIRSVARKGVFKSFSGTSMAGPHVAGVVALMISANPDLAGQVDIIEDILESTAEPFTSSQDCNDLLGGKIPNAVYGYGIINALAAVKRALDYIPVSVHDQQVSIHIFPNPTTDYVTFTSDTKDVGIQQISIYDFKGVLVADQSPGGRALLHTIDISGLPAGIYFYSILTTNGRKQGKIVKI